MFKRELVKLYQQRLRPEPAYASVRTGPEHTPRFTATVTVCGQTFESPSQCKSRKDAENAAARVAFDYFSTTPPPPAASVTALPQIQPVAVAADPPPPPLSTLEMHMYKNHLQQHAQKAKIAFPVYTCEAEGPARARRFKSKVSINGESYETSEFFTTQKEAEQAAAKIACEALSVDTVQEKKCFYKNLLQELAVERRLDSPSYETVRSGSVFVTTVKIGSKRYEGVEATKKKKAEMNAAECAYSDLTRGCLLTDSSKVSPTNTSSPADNMSHNVQPSAATRKHKSSTDEAYDREDDHVLTKRVKLNTCSTCCALTQRFKAIV